MLQDSAVPPHLLDGTDGQVSPLDALRDVAIATPGRAWWVCNDRMRTFVPSRVAPHRPGVDVFHVGVGPIRSDVQGCDRSIDDVTAAGARYADGRYGVLVTVTTLAAAT